MPRSCHSAPLPGTEQARILWGTGRGNSQRTGSRLYGTLEGSSKSAWPAQLEPGDVLTYTLRLENPGPTLSGVLVTDTLPAGVGSRGNLWASSGSYGEAGGTITWTGQVLGGVPVTITFGVTISEGIPTPQALANLALIDDGLGNVWQRQAVSVVGGYSIYLPLVVKP